MVGYVSIPWRVEYPKPNVCEVFFLFWWVVEWKCNKKDQGGVEITMEKQGKNFRWRNSGVSAVSPKQK